MGHPLRPLAPGFTYHVTARGNERRAIFADAADRRRLLRLLTPVVAARGWSVGTYCLMPNHLHLVVRTPEPDLSDGMRDWLSPYALGFNERHDRVGHLFQRRFHSRVVIADAHHLELFRYLALNPVRARLCADPATFPWSAHAALLGLAVPPRFLDPSLTPFAGNRTRYATFVAEAGPSHLHDLLGDATPTRLRLASAAGFTTRQIAALLDISHATVARRIRETGTSGASVSRRRGETETPEGSVSAGGS